MTTENTSMEVQTTQPNTVSLGFSDSASFDHLMRVAKMFNASTLVPEQFRGSAGMANCIIALDMSNRMRANPMAVMQQIYIVHGKPAWSSQFIIACINTCGRFEPLRFDTFGSGDKLTCVAWTVDRGYKIPVGINSIKKAREAAIPIYEGAPVSIETAKKEGWYSKNGSKWQSFPELMLQYRAATFFGRTYAPEMLMGMKSTDEIIDVEGEVVDVRTEPIPAANPMKTATANTGETVKVEAAPEPAKDAKCDPEQLLELCKAAGIAEEKLCAWFTGRFKIEVATLNDLAFKAPKRGGQLISNWETYKTQIV